MVLLLLHNYENANYTNKKNIINANKMNNKASNLRNVSRIISNNNIQCQVRKFQYFIDTRRYYCYHYFNY